MARPKVSMNEVMGKGAGQKITLERLPEILGDKMPRIPLNRVGKVRLIQALKNRYGAGYRNLPGVSDTLREFEDATEHDEMIERVKRIRVGR